MADYCFLINSCDSYKDAWPFFFFLLKENWTSNDIPKLYINTETEDYVYEGLDITTLKNGPAKCPWGERLLNALKKIDSEYVLMLCEDHYSMRPIRVDIIERCVEYLKNDSSILAFQLAPAAEVYRKKVKPQKEIYPGFVLRERKGEYTIIAGPTLWRRRDLMLLIKKKDSPWEFEWIGSLRTQLFGKKIFCWKSLDEPIYDYDILRGGAIRFGKWVWFRVKELEEKYNYHMEYGNRDRIEEDWLNTEKSLKTERPKRNLFQKHVVSRIRRFFAFIKKSYNQLYGLVMGILSSYFNYRR